MRIAKYAKRYKDYLNLEKENESLRDELDALKYQYEKLQEKTADPQKIDSFKVHLRNISGMSTRLYNELRAARLETLGEIIQYDRNELMKFRNFGRKSLQELEEILERYGLHFES